MRMPYTESEVHRAQASIPWPRSLESFKQPVLILVILPLALIGMLWALYLTGKTLEIFVLMSGVMLLIGILENNTILKTAMECSQAG